MITNFDVLNNIIRENVLKLFKVNTSYNDITIVNPISDKDYKSIRRSVRINLTKAGGYFKITDAELKEHLVRLGATFNNK